MQLIVKLDDHKPGSAALIQGMQSRAVVLDRKDQRNALGVVFESGAARVFLGTPLDAMTDNHVGLNELVHDEQPLRQQLMGGATADQLFDRMEHWLRARIQGEADPLIRAAMGMLQSGEQNIATLASNVGTSERALRRRFRAEVGLPPKQMSRVLRLQRALQGLRGSGSLAEVALCCGYHDQAHLTHELRELAGVTPSEYRRRRPVHANHLG